MKNTTLLLGLLLATSGLNAQIVYKSIWYDSFNADLADHGSGLATLNYNISDTATRQASAFGPVSYVEAGLTTPDDWQIAIDLGNPQRLRLAHNMTSVVVSPGQNFSGVVDSSLAIKSSRYGEIIGKKMEFQLGFNGLGVGTTQATFTFGASAPLQTADGLWNFAASAPHLAGGISIAFKVDPTNGNFIQVSDNSGTPYSLGNLLPFTPTPGVPVSVEIIVDDTTDGNPWDGIGRTQFSVLVDGVNIAGLGGVYDLDGTAFTSNYISMEGSSGGPFVTNLHTYDDVRVYSANVPEPATFGMALGLLAFAGVIWRRRRLL